MIKENRLKEPYLSIIKTWVLECDQTTKSNNPEFMRTMLKAQGSNPKMDTMIKNFMNNPPWDRPSPGQLHD
jgi:hypothetical protein